jgi:cation transport ATPase
MTTKKQRRRREKEQRHEYVWVDEEGNELAPEEASAKQASATPAPRGGREPNAPSWQKSLKRGLIFAPIMFVTVMLLSSGLTLGQQITQTLFIVSVFIPFSYFLDRMMYRSFQRRRSARNRAGGGKHGS